jgi:hypothetical protein
VVDNDGHIKAWNLIQNDLCLWESLLAGLLMGVKVQDVKMGLNPDIYVDLYKEP